MPLGEQDLEQIIGAAKVDEYGSNKGHGKRDDQVIENVLAQAEDLSMSYLLKGWTREQARLMIEEDQGLRVQIAWVAAELLTERRSEFLNAEGHGRYWAQYERAIDYFDRLAKTKARSVGESKAGQNSLRGGTVTPKAPPNTAAFVFASSKGNPGGSGGF